MDDSRREENSLFKIPWYLKGQKYDGERKGHTKIKVKFCEICKMAWEFDKYSTEKVLRYEDFPKYGIEKKVCRDCC